MRNTQFENLHPRNPRGEFVTKTRTESSGIHLQSAAPAHTFLHENPHSSSIDYMNTLNQCAEEWLDNDAGERDDYPYMYDYLLDMSDSGPTYIEDTLRLVDDLDFDRTLEGDDVARTAHIYASRERRNLAMLYDKCSRNLDVFWEAKGTPATLNAFNAIEEILGEYDALVPINDSRERELWSKNYDAWAPQLKTRTAKDLDFLHDIRHEQASHLMDLARKEAATQAVIRVCSHYDPLPE